MKALILHSIFWCVETLLVNIVYVRFIRFFFFKQKTAYEMRISDWSSDVCSSDLLFPAVACDARRALRRVVALGPRIHALPACFSVSSGSDNAVRRMGSDRKSVV